MEILTFELSGQRLAVPLRSVREVIRAVAITRLPGAPPIVEGIVDVRGEVAPVFDLRARFGLPARPLWPEQHFIIASAGRRTVALRVDQVEWLADVPEAAIDEPSRIVTGATHIAGVARLDDGLVLIHDLDRFLSDAEAETLDAALASALEGTSGARG